MSWLKSQALVRDIGEIAYMERKDKLNHEDPS